MLRIGDIKKQENVKEHLLLASAFFLFLCRHRFLNDTFAIDNRNG